MFFFAFLVLLFGIALWQSAWRGLSSGLSIYEPPHDKTIKMVCAPGEDSDKPWHPPSLIRVFAVRMKNAWFLSYPLSAQRRRWSDWADGPAYLSLRWAHNHFVGFVMRRLICCFMLDAVLSECRFFLFCVMGGCRVRWHRLLLIAFLSTLLQPVQGKCKHSWHENRSVIINN